MRICFIQEGVPGKIGGAAVMFWLLSKELVIMGHDVCVVTNELPKDLLRSYPSQVRVVETEVSDGKVVTSSSFMIKSAAEKLVHTIRGRHKLYETIESFCPHVICVPTEYPALLAFLVKRKYEIPAIYFKAHNTVDDWDNLAPFPQRYFFSFAEKAALRLPFDAFMGNEKTRVVYENLRIKPEKVPFRVTVPGVDSDPAVQTDGPSIRRSLGLNGEKILVYVGALIKVKGVEYAIHAMKKLVTEDNYHLLVVGDGQEKENLMQMSEYHGLGHYITFVGEKPFTEVSDYVAASDMVIVPSLSELFGAKVMYDGWALGKPVVTTAVGDVPRIATDYQDALLVPPRDSDSIATKVREIFSNDQLRKTLVGNGRKEIEKYSAKRLADIFLETCQEIKMPCN